MKKFLIYLAVILVAVSLGFTVFYLTRNNEKIYISTSSVYMREGDEIDDLSIVWENKKAFSEYEVLSSNEGIAKYDKETGKLKAVSGGIATITFRTSSVKFRNLSCQVYVGDGSLTNPFYITNAEQLRQIGAYKLEGEDKVIEYGLDKCYKLVSNIDLLDGYNNTGFWIPIGTGNENGFTGSFDGNGYTISNASVDREELIKELAKLENVEPNILNYNTFTNAGLFSVIGVNGRVCNLKVDNIIIHGAYNDGYVGAVAGKNFGTIERTEVLNGHIDVRGSYAIGGIAALNEATDAVVEEEYSRYTARIDRCGANVTMGITKAETSEDIIINGVKGKIGGVTGVNHGGIVIYSYAMGDVYLNVTPEAEIVYGGLVGSNNVKTYATNDSKYMYNYTGAHIKDSYSAIELKNGKEAKGKVTIGGVIGVNTDIPALDLDSNGIDIDKDKVGSANKIVGNYYNSELLNPVVVAPAAETESTEPTVPEEGEENPDTPVTPEEPTEPTVTGFVGMGKNVLDGKDVDTKDKEYVIMGKTTNELKLSKTYLSHINTQRIWNEDTAEYITKDTTIPWKLDVVWFIKENINNGYPYLNYANIEVSDDLIDISDGYTIKTFEELKNMKLDGNYVIAQNIVCPDNEIWIPIGTVSRPFYGSLKAGKYSKAGAESYYTISNLKTTTNPETLGEIEFAGLFGVTSGAQGGVIEDVIIVNPTFTNGKVAGGIVASNGYASEHIGLTIKNCKVLGGTIRATEKVGGLVGDNYGTVSGGIVCDSADEYENITKLDIILYASGESVGGGMVGYNNANATISGGTVYGQVAVVARSGENNASTVSVGGIVGHNNGSVSSVIAKQTKGVAIEKLKGQVGGIAGTNMGSITKAFASTEISASTENDQVYAGGLVGKLIGDSELTVSAARSGSVTGYYAGGLVGYVNYSKQDYRYQLSVDKNNNLKELVGKDTISQCSVVDFSVTGKRSAGIASIIDNGIVRNCYTTATIYGVDNNSTKAGFAVDLNLNNDSVGIIINCYASVKFNSGNGSNYAVTPKEIFKNPAFTFGVDALKRNAGYCFDFVYNKDAGGSEPDTGNVLGDLWDGWFNKDKLPAATGSQMQGSAPKKFTDRNFSNEIWQFTDGAYPSLIAINALIIDLGISF